MAPPTMRSTAEPMRARRLLATFILLSLLGLISWAFVLEPRALVVRRVALDLPHWDPAHAGLRIALLSDLHIGSPFWDLDRLSTLVERCNQERPDLVLLAGDYLINGVKFGRYVPPEPIAARLGGLVAPLGVIAVLGNHDWWNDGEAMRAALQGQGVVVLENEVAVLSHHGEPIRVVGLADLLTRPQALRATFAPLEGLGSTLALVHEPDVFPGVPPFVSLTLAGHTHGGQVNLPLLGRPIVPSRFEDRYAQGHIVEEGRHLFVTSGVGTSILPVRFRVPPELVILTLRPAD